MSISNFHSSYSNAEAERGKFVVLDSNHLETMYNYPSGGRGKYALLVKDVDYQQSATATTAFGEPISVTITPVFQLDGIYGLPATRFEQYTAGTGSVSANDIMEVFTGTGANSYGVLRSRRTVRYRPGQGAMARFTAKFSTGTSGYIQRAGFFNQEQAIQIGYQDENFGIIRQTGGRAQIMELNLTSGAIGTENVTVVLNNTHYDFSVTNVGVSANIAQIGNQAYTGWTVNHRDNSVYFLSNSLGPKTGSYSVSSNGGLSGNIITEVLGIADSVTFTPQSAFNLDKLDGTGTSGITIDPTKLNVFQIHFRWLGAGEIRFAMENPYNGDMLDFHHIHWSNKNIIPHIANPSMKIGYVAASTGGTGSNISVGGASIMGAIEGDIVTNYYPVAVSRARTDAMNSAGTVYHILTIKNNLIVNNTVKKINLREILLKNIASGIKTASSVPGLLYAYIDAATTDVLTFKGVGECSSYSTTSTIITTGTPIAIYTIPGDGNINIDVSDLRLAIPPNSQVSFGISATNNITTGEVSVIYVED